MFASAIFTTLAACSVHTAMAQQQWGVKADFTRCDNAAQLEVQFDGATKLSGAEQFITDFTVEPGFLGTITIKDPNAGSVDFPQEVRFQILTDKSPIDALWGRASVWSGTGQPASVAQVSWTLSTDTATPREGEEPTIRTSVEFDTLNIFYCGVP